MEQRPIGTVLIGANALLREGLAHTLDGADFEIIASASYLDPIAVSFPNHQTVLLIIEAGSDADSTVGQIVSFKERCPAGRVVVLAHQLQLPEMVLAFTAGANAYLVSVATSDVFIKILELVLLGETILPTSLLNLLYANESTDDGDDNDSDEDLEAIEEGALPRMNDNGVPRFSARQRLILRYLIEGDANKAIARKIHLTEATVKIHVRAILRKIRVQNRTQAAIWAMNNGSFNSEKDSDSSPAPDLATEQIASPGRNSALPSPQGIKIGGARDGTGTGVNHVVQSRIDSEYD